MIDRLAKLNRRALLDAFGTYCRACYGSAPLPPAQVREIRQAFLSGVHWLNELDDYEPGAVGSALREILGADNPAIAKAPAPTQKRAQRDAQTLRDILALCERTQNRWNQIGGATPELADEALQAIALMIMARELSERPE